MHVVRDEEGYGMLVYGSHAGSASVFTLSCFAAWREVIHSFDPQQDV